jgi:agmatinase
MSIFRPDGPSTRQRAAGLLERAKTERHHHPDFDKLNMRGWKAAEKEGKLPSAAWQKEKAWALRMGLTGSDSLEDKSIPTFARGELPHYAGINTFLKAPYIEDVTQVGAYDAAIIGVPV